jgi:hypothetical protein
VTASALATFIALIAAKILNAYWSRTDVTDAARFRVYKEMEAANERAGVWRNVAWSDPTRAATLGVLPGAKGLRLDDKNNITGGGPRGSSVS